MAKLPANEGRNDGAGEVAGYKRVGLGERDAFTQSQEMEAYDSLPAPIRHAIDESSWRWSAYTTVQRLAMYQRQLSAPLPPTVTSPGDIKREMMARHRGQGDPISRIVREIEKADMDVVGKLYADKDFADHPRHAFGVMKPHRIRGKTGTRRRIQVSY